MAIRQFEEIQAWQEARKLTSMVYRITRESEAFNKDFGLKDQIQRAAVSIMANIAEGFDSNSNAEFIKFLRYSVRSGSELQSHLYVALDQSYIAQQTFDELYRQAVSVKNLLLGFIRYLRQHPKP